MKTEHILVIRFSALGDVAMTVPVIAALARQYPHVRITMLSRGFARPFFEGLAPNVSFMEADVKVEYRGFKGLNALYRRLTAKNFTAIADLHDVLRSQYLRVRFDLGRYKVAHINKHRADRRKLVSASHKVLKPLPSPFDNYAEVFARLGYPVRLDPGFSLKGRFELSEDRVAALRADRGAPEHGALLIGIAPFAAHQGKIYPLQLMEKVVAGLCERHPDARLFLFGGGEKEMEVFHEWTAKYAQCVTVGDHLSGLREELALMERLNVMISMDSANMHFASLVALPVVSVWGATHPYAGFMGYGQSPENAVHIDLPCRPCSIYGQKPCMRGDWACMQNISPEQIISKVETVILTKNRKTL